MVLMDTKAITPEAQYLVDSYQNYFDKKTSNSTNTIKVGQAFGAVALFYERFRNTLDFKGTHLLRRSAIERIIRRKLWEKKSITSDNVALSVIKELTWAHYIQNNTVAGDTIDQIAKILDKYRALYSHAPKLKEVLLGIISSEIEELLDPSLFFNEILSDSMFVWFKKNFNWQDELDDETKDLHIYMAIERSLPKSDRARIYFHLVRRRFPNFSSLDAHSASKILPDLTKLLEKFDTIFDSPAHLKLFRIIQKHNPAFQVLKEIVEQNPDQAKQIISNPSLLEKEIEKVCDSRYDQIGQNIRVGIVRSIIYIFVTKIAAIFIIEIPYEILMTGKINTLSSSINLIAPIFLMLLVGSAIKKPDEDNTKRINKMVEGFVYGKSPDEKQTFSLDLQRKRGTLYRIFASFYAFLFVIILGTVAYILSQIGFNLVSIFVFFAFISLVTLFGLRVRFTATEMDVEEKDTGFVSHMLTNLTLPFLDLGVLLSKGLNSLNFVSLLMDFLIEGPIKNLISVFNEWSQFVKEKEKEYIEVPSS